jgi:hypothetical protein
MGNTQLSQIQRLYLEALLDGPQETGKLVTMVRDKLTQLKSGNNPVGGTARSQAVLDELEKEGYITAELKHQDYFKEARGILKLFKFKNPLV